VEAELSRVAIMFRRAWASPGLKRRRQDERGRAAVVLFFRKG